MAHAQLARCRSAQQLEDLRLDGDVERGGRLVGDQQVRLAGERHRRSSRAGACRRRTGADSRRARRSASGMPTSASSSTARRARLAPRRVAVMRSAASAICSPIAEHGIERGHRVLEDHGDARPRSARISRSRQRQRGRCPSNRTRPPTIRPGGSISRMIESAVTVLPRARFADDAEHLAGATA